MLWLALHFPSLPLDLLGEAAQNGPPLAVVEQIGNRRLVVGANDAAQQAGVRAGMTLAAASVLVAELHTRTRDPHAERAALDRLANHALCFSGLVSLARDTVLIEVGASARLFGGLLRLVKRIVATYEEQHWTVQAAGAPTPSGARLLARTGRRHIVRTHDALRALLRDLPIDLLETDVDVRDGLYALGLERIEQALKLPRTGLAKRFGPELVFTLDRLTGDAAEPVEPFVAPEDFRALHELPYAVEHSDGLLFPLKRLVNDLGAWLTVRQLAVQRIELSLQHDDHPPTVCVPGLVAASADAAHLFELAKSAVERLMLPAPTLTLVLHALDCTPLAGGNRDLFAPAGGEPEDLARLFERLSGRLGRDALGMPALVDDHRPERAARSDADTLVASVGRKEPEAISGTSKRPGTRPTRRKTASGPAGTGTPVLKARRPFARQAPSPPFPHRPLFLLDPPRLLGEWPGDCWRDARLDSAERIESGWWDDAPATRDYFRLSTRTGQRLWVYRERGPVDRWYVHGVFA